MYCAHIIALAVYYVPDIVGYYTNQLTIHILS